jgi:hypothetical protein
MAGGWFRPAGASEEGETRSHNATLAMRRVAMLNLPCQVVAVARPVVDRVAPFNQALRRWHQVLSLQWAIQSRSIIRHWLKKKPITAPPMDYSASNGFIEADNAILLSGCLPRKSPASGCFGMD